MTYAFPAMLTQAAAPIDPIQLFSGSTGEFAAAQDKPERVEFSRQLTMASFKSKGLVEELRDANGAAKRWASQVSMRLGSDVRARLFKQLDRLHDPDEWHDNDKPLQLESFKSFIRAYLSGEISGKPAIALTASGHLTTVWEHGGRKLLIEFLPGDRIRYLVSLSIDGQPERAAGDTSTARITQVLAPFVDAQWFRAG